MIEVNVAQGYSGVYLFHVLNLRTKKARSIWVPQKVAFNVFAKSTIYYPMIQDSWKARPTKRGRRTKPIKMEESPNGELQPLIRKLLEEMNIEFDMS